eukprot:CAMPEP_0181231158 /NCGR_PEP_ID=MMETSP1096-20121128/34927_1 /TAXON_ID=156174 ORGANISM="Chrysochromulina ericina, Strain CCMP281" /NCGR_SAMPLE_ID=MMETSP1096 /ASSEMBLY_ACC=CAM_ASM_000453 /LENGTH=85 /DNA_ID=CAMNT_0023325121 /DNA_START=447 /DNA_END=704 /DNA_ORIENTATION=-
MARERPVSVGARGICLPSASPPPNNPSSSTRPSSKAHVLWEPVGAPPHRHRHPLVGLRERLGHQLDPVRWLLGQLRDPRGGGLHA